MWIQSSPITRGSASVNLWGFKNKLHMYFQLSLLIVINNLLGEGLFISGAYYGHMKGIRGHRLGGLWRLWHWLVIAVGLDRNGRKEIVLKGEQMEKNNYWFRRTTLDGHWPIMAAAASPRACRRVRRKWAVQASGPHSWGLFTSVASWYSAGGILSLAAFLAPSHRCEQASLHSLVLV